MYSLKQLGWTSYFEDEFIKTNKNEFIPARVAVENKQRYVLLTEAGEISGEVIGKLLYSAESISELPKVGDWVNIVLFEDERKGLIHKVFPRKSKLSRKTAERKTEEQIIASNIDKAFIVQALDNNFNIRRLERYLSMVIEGKAEPVIIFNKMDLVGDLKPYIELTNKYSDDYKIIFSDALTGKGIDKISSFISEGETFVFIGSSGVGKSTIINRIISDPNLKTQEISSVTGKGKHTTTRREMIILPTGGILIDTPGMRELSLWKSESGIESTFSDIEKFSEDCKFKNCTHSGETGCAVIKAVEEGLLEKSRLMNYKKLQKELNYLDERDSALSVKKQWQKQISKEIKRFYKNNDKR